MRLISAVAACLLACAPACATPAEASGPVAANDDGPSLIGLQYRGAPRGRWTLRPGIGIAVARQWASGARLGLAGYHVSNGGLHRPNVGSDALVLFLTRPIRR